MLTLIRGLPGSGKSTFARTHYPDRLIVEVDMLLTTEGRYQWTADDHQGAKYLVDDIALRVLRMGADLVLPGCFTSRQQIQRYVSMAERFHQPWEVIALMCAPRPSAHDVPAIVYAMMAERWEDWPDQKEIK